jgi:hypothetical protein
MRLSLYKLLLPLLLLSVPAAHTAAQDTAAVHTAAHTAPTEAQWQQLQHDDAFGYAGEKELKEKPKEKPAENNALADALGAIAAFFASTMGLVILFTGLFLVVAYAVFRIFIGEKSFVFGKKKKQIAEDIPVQTEEELLDTDWEQRLRAAYEKADLRMAIRYAYMWLLQLMQERSLIAYRNDKTNNDYYHELAETQHKQAFRQLTRQYEFTWYGQYPVSNADYQAYMQLFDSIKTRLN